MNPEEFARRNRDYIAKMGSDSEFIRISKEWFRVATRFEYSYHFTWLGRPIIQFPQDVMAMQEVIWSVQPDLIVETGIARGGSLVFHASLLELIGKGRVLGIDIDIRPHNRVEIEKHPMRHRITMVEGSSVSEEVVDEVRRVAGEAKTVLVVLDSNHTHEHVHQELKLYSPLVTVESYLVVFDTVIEDLPGDLLVDRPWSLGDNPATALSTFLQGNEEFERDDHIEKKLGITVAPGGYLRRIRAPSGVRT